MAREKRFTKVPMVFSSYRLTSSDNELLKAAAAKDGISQSEFLRRAIRERTRWVLYADVAHKAPVGGDQ